MEWYLQVRVKDLVINLKTVSVVPEKANVLGFYCLRGAAGDVT